ncbi:YgaP-like transmembrane domain [Sphingoaurantiacus capsulatus]|uniref:YgaP-like transmembrane domain n=1 Tax=Sphingoaurantiacus capsulatus TaxID=1771310 RepID=A0ABV7XA08_9SPHN
MFATNVTAIERLLRVLLGGGLAAYGVVSLDNIIVAAVGACLALTGLIGFCPACALAGRRLKPKS